MPLPDQPILPAEIAYTDLEQLFLDEQPKLWPTNQNSNFGVLRKTLTAELQLAVDQLVGLALEMSVATSSGYLETWEKYLGLPVSTGLLPDENRRQLIYGRLQKGLFSRTRRDSVVADAISATFGVSAALTPAGLTLDAGGVSLFSEIASGDPHDFFTITENITNFSFDIQIDPGIDLDLVTLQRELNKILPAGLSFTLSVSTSPLPPSVGGPTASGFSYSAPAVNIGAVE